MVFGALTAAGLTQASGETATGSQQTTFNAMNQFMGLMTDPFTPGRGDGTNAPRLCRRGFRRERLCRIRQAAHQERARRLCRDLQQGAGGRALMIARWSVWAAGFGGSQTTDGNATLGSNTTTSRIFGMAAGADYRFSPYTLAGFALAGGGTNFSVGERRQRPLRPVPGRRLRPPHRRPAYLTGALAYGWQDITTDRTVTIAGIDRLRAQFNANAWSGRVEGGYRFVTPWIGGIGITPYAAGAVHHLRPAGLCRTGRLRRQHLCARPMARRASPPPAANSACAPTNPLRCRNAILTLRGRAAWAHDFNPDRAVGATFQTLPGASFVVNGARQASDAALTTASAEMKWLNGWSVAATFEGEFSNVTRSYAGKGVVRYAW